MDIYSVGDYVTGNCTSGKSNPAPSLAWFINGFKADTWLTDKYPILSHENGRYSRALGLRFLAEKKHFIGPGSSISLKCSSSVADMPALSATVEPKLASASANQKLAQERLHNLGSRSSYLSRWLLPLCLLAWMGAT
ncbi:uncharacterized protein LOC106669162 [Cimex lectularius]|uniref:Ig-like domain-containing protein n=1 Tax=Cimex lectularius TaxID=79782 RepID=A0A8I6SUC7_CIMLE|nr:uncharacterized protein LOC106669162 [Cimex lectularius]